MQSSGDLAGFGVLVTGGQMANFTGLAAARQWWGERHGVDVSVDGLAASSSLHTGTARTEGEARAQLGDALDRPSEPCGIRIDGAIVPATG